MFEWLSEKEFIEENAEKLAEFNRLSEKEFIEENAEKLAELNG